jgi:primase-polymerase (primpol)-like protein
MALQPTFSTDAVPSELRALPRWLVWKPVVRARKMTKRPVNATIDDPSTWLTFDQAVQLATRESAGVGFVLGDGLIGLDFDLAVTADGEVHAAVADAIDGLGSYAELSPSGRGVHILVRGSIPSSRKLAATASLPAREIYDGARFFTITGRCLRDLTKVANGSATQAALNRVYATLFMPGAAHQDQPLSDDAILHLLTKAKNSKKGLALLSGDTAAYGSASEADFAFARILTFYTRDLIQIDRLFRRSGLMRPKWNERHGIQTYGEQTINRAIAAGGHRYRVPTTGLQERVERHEAKAWAKFPLWWLRALHGSRGPAPLRVLIALASYANSDGEAFPSRATIAAHAGLSENAVKSALAVLKDEGILSERCRHRASSVRILRYARTGKPTYPISLKRGVPVTSADAEQEGATGRTNRGRELDRVERDLGPLTDQLEPTSSNNTGGTAARKPQKIIRDQRMPVGEIARK